MSPTLPWQENLSRRERQTMDALLAMNQATAAELTEKIAEPISYSAVRAVLRVLEEKGLVSHEYDGPRYLYRPTIARQRAKKSVLKQVLDTFFGGSREELVATLLDTEELKAGPEELDKLAKLIEEARKKGR